MKAYGFCFARGGSKGVLQKNLQRVGPRTLVGHSIYVGKLVEEFAEFFVSTDCDEIAEESERLGATVIRRPDYLASDSSREIDAWKHAVEWVKANRGVSEFIFSSLPATSPLRLPIDVKSALSKMRADESLEGVIAVRPAERSPFFNIVKKTDQDCVVLANQGMGVFNRQEAPELFDITTIAYTYLSSYVDRMNSLFGGRISSIDIPRERSIDIDVPLDLEIARFLYDHLKFDEQF